MTLIKFRIHGRGGQGGVTLAKILAFVYWTEGKWVQAFGNYAAERTGAPIQAFTLVDDEQITNRNRVYDPDHLIILDPTLIDDAVFSGLKPGAFLIIDAPKSPEEFREFAGHRIATVDARSIALQFGLGTRTTPITNTALAGAITRVFGLEFESLTRTLKALGLPEINVESARMAFESVQIGDLNPGEPKVVPIPLDTSPVPPLVTGNLGTEPRLNVADWKSQRPHRATERLPPCNCYCPAGNDVQGFLSEVVRGDLDKALEILHRTSPLPGSHRHILGT